MMADLSGPVFTKINKALDEAADETEDAIGNRGVDIIQMKLRMNLKHPTGRFQSGIKLHKASPGRVIDDGNLIYGYWLEGIGSRNAPKTVFPGYRTFELTSAILNQQSLRIAVAIVRKKLEELQ